MGSRLYVVLSIKVNPGHLELSCTQTRKVWNYSHQHLTNTLSYRKPNFALKQPTISTSLPCIFRLRCLLSCQAQIVVLLKQKRMQDKSFLFWSLHSHALGTVVIWHLPFYTWSSRGMVTVIPSQVPVISNSTWKGKTGRVLKLSWTRATGMERL